MVKMGNGCDMETYGDLGVEKCKYKKTAIAFWQKFLCVFFLQVAWCRLTKYGVSHSSKYQFWCQSFWMDLMCFWWCVGSRLIVFFKYTFGRFSSGIFVATASFPTSLPSCVGNGGSKLWGKPSAPGNQSYHRKRCRGGALAGDTRIPGLINKELGSRHSQNGRIHYSVFGKEFGRRKKCMLLLSEVDFFCPYLGPWSKGFMWNKEHIHSGKPSQCCHGKCTSTTVGSAGHIWEGAADRVAWWWTMNRW